MTVTEQKEKNMIYDVHHYILYVFELNDISQL